MRNKITRKEYNKKYINMYRQKLRENHKCIKCFIPLENNYRKYCDDCLLKERKRRHVSLIINRDSTNEYGRIKNFKYKLTALRKISGNTYPSCVICNNTDIRVLTINHKNGDGASDRCSGFIKNVALGKRKIDDLDVRCHNCNILFEYERGRFKLPIKWKEILEEEEPWERKKIRDKEKYIPQRKNIIWTKDDIEFIIKNYNKKTAKEIGLLLERTATSIRNKIRKLQLKKRGD